MKGRCLPGEARVYGGVVSRHEDWSSVQVAFERNTHEWRMLNDT